MSAQIAAQRSLFKQTFDTQAPRRPPASFVVVSICTNVEIDPIAMSEDEFSDLMLFLTRTLTDHDCLELTSHIPSRVPSGLPVSD